MSKLKKAGIVLALAYVGVLVYNHHSNDIRNASVKIVNRAMNSGGTGLILSSNSSETNILTNDHVCKLVKAGGGLVLTRTSEYQVVSVIESEVSDLCLLQVSADLGLNTTVSSKSPRTYDKALISGHPALMPNVISTGHFSGRAIIQVLTGMRPCSEKEQQDPKTAMVCMFFGGLPVVKSYESVLVTATIMPGSSGSGVYNSSNELSGVVFAGSGSLGYAWTVPYEQVLNFLNRECNTLIKQNLSQEIDIFGLQDESKRIKEAQEKCVNLQTHMEGLENPEDLKVIKNFCSIIQHDVTWRE